jgi:beta-glucanase (GH16 family)
MNAKNPLVVALALCALAGPFHVARAVTPTLIWSDEFNGATGSGPDPTKWTYDLGAGGWGNDELENYTDSRDNSLIVADPLATDGLALAIRAQNSNGSYTSARIKTQGLFAFQYGRMEARARLPSGAGLWPAFWTLGSNEPTVGWPACGEVDIMEWVPQTPSEIYGSLHSVGSNNLTQGYILPNSAVYSAAYHVFAIDWYPNEIVFSMDGIVYEDQKESALPSSTAWPFTQPFFIILNFAVGGQWPGPPNSSTVFPADYRVDYVRVYTLPTTPPANLVWPPAPPAGVVAFSPSSSQISVSWQPPASTFGATLTGYSLQRSTDAAFTQNVTTLYSGTSTNYMDSSAHAGSTYYYRVTAASANGTSDSSTPAQSTARTSSGSSNLINISSKGFVGTGGNVLIDGFVINGSAPQTVLVRASGPALAAAPFDIAGSLPDPKLQLYSGGTVIGENAGWGGNPQITAAAATVAAFPWSHPSSSDSALLMTLTPGAYTAILSGASGDTGVSILEVYAVP